MQGNSTVGGPDRVRRYGPLSSRGERQDDEGELDNGPGRQTRASLGVRLVLVYTDSFSGLVQQDSSPNCAGFVLTIFELRIPASENLASGAGDDDGVFKLCRQ